MKTSEENTQNHAAIAVKEPETVYEAIRRAAENQLEEDRWVSAGDVADMTGIPSGTVSREAIRLIADDKIVVKIFPRGVAQRVPRFRLKQNGGQK